MCHQAEQSHVIVTVPTTRGNDSSRSRCHSIRAHLLISTRPNERATSAQEPKSKFFTLLWSTPDFSPGVLRFDEMSTSCHNKNHVQKTPKTAVHENGSCYEFSDSGAIGYRASEISARSLTPKSFGRAKRSTFIPCPNTANYVMNPAWKPLRQTLSRPGPLSDNQKAAAGTKLGLVGRLCG